jgi:hypothetical protein
MRGHSSVENFTSRKISEYQTEEYSGYRSATNIENLGFSALSYSNNANLCDKFDIT